MQVTSSSSKSGRRNPTIDQQHQTTSPAVQNHLSNATATITSGGNTDLASNNSAIQGIKLTPQNTVLQTNTSAQVTFRPTQIVGRQTALSAQPISHSSF